MVKRFLTLYFLGYLLIMSKPECSCHDPIRMPFKINQYSKMKSMLVFNINLGKKLASLVLLHPRRSLGFEKLYLMCSESEEGLYGKEG